MKIHIIAHQVHVHRSENLVDCHELSCSISIMFFAVCPQFYTCFCLFITHIHVNIGIDRTLNANSW